MKDLLVQYVEENQKLFDQVKEKNVLIKILTNDIAERDKEIKKLKAIIKKLENNDNTK